MARKRREVAKDVPDLTGRQRCRFPDQWSDLDQQELQRRHDQAALLIAQGHGAVTWRDLFGDR